MIRTRVTVAQPERAHRVAFLSRKPLSRTRVGKHGSFTFLGGEPHATFAHRRGTLPQVAFFRGGGPRSHPALRNGGYRLTRRIRRIRTIRRKALAAATRSLETRA